MESFGVWDEFRLCNHSSMRRKFISETYTPDSVLDIVEGLIPRSRDICARAPRPIFLIASRAASRRASYTARIWSSFWIIRLMPMKPP